MPQHQAPFAPSPEQLDDWRIGLTSDMAEVKTTLDTLVHQLMGNGQPGTLSKFERRISALEKVKNQLAGAVALAGALGGWILRGRLGVN